MLCGFSLCVHKEYGGHDESVDGHVESPLDLEDYDDRPNYQVGQMRETQLSI